MIRLLAAFAWLRWRTSWNALRGASKRDTMEAASRILVAGAGIVAVGLGVPVALGLGVFGFAAGWSAGRAAATAPVWLNGLRVALLVPVFGIVVGPLVAGAQGATIYSRYLLLPVPRRVLYALEIAAHALDPWLLLFAPALVLFPAGMLAAGRPGPAIWTLGAAVLYLAMLAAAGAAITHVVQAAFRGRRRREWFAVAVMMLLSSLGVVPAVVQRVSRGHVEARLGAASAPADAPAWLRAVPSDLVAGTASAALDGRASGVLPRLLVLAAAVSGFGIVSAAAFRRVIEPPADTSRRRRNGARVAGRERSFATSPSGVVAETTVRLVLRSVRGKIIVLSTPLVIGVMGTVLGSGAGIPSPLHFGPVLYLLGGVFGTLSLQPVVLNQFAVERQGLARTFLAPLSDLEIVRGKAVAAVTLAAIMAGLTAAVAAWFPAGPDPILWVAALPVPPAVIWAVSPFAALLSAAFPVTTDLDRAGSRGGNAHAVSGFAAMLVFPAAYAVVAGPGFLVWTLTGNAYAAAGLTAAMAGLGAAVAFPLFRVAASALAKRRENVLMVAAGR